MKLRLLIACLFIGPALSAQDSLVLSQDAIYERPFVLNAKKGKFSTAFGGYLEANTNYFATDGVSEGFSMEMRRFNIFLYSDIGDRIQMISELEFEHGTEEIALETALLDYTYNSSLNFRAGILLPQIGLVNTNHDSPLWEFIDRPLSSTELIPSTLSEVGFGLYGKFFPKNLVVSYDIYLVNGLQDGIILNSEGRTHLKSGKSEEMFGEDNNGTPMINGRLGVANKRVELGFSYYGGTYNSYRIEGEVVDKKRNLSILALDLKANIGRLKLKGEYVKILVDVPSSVGQLYATQQQGGFVDLIYPIIQRPILGHDEAVINANLRFEAVDYHQGTFIKTDTPIRDDVLSVGPGLSFRPGSNTVFRANYRYRWIVDVLGNPAAREAGFQFGIASYF